MANEITVNGSVKLLNGNLVFNSAPTSFRATQAVKKGPTPGTITVTTGGVTISLAELTTPGIGSITNTEPAGGNYVSYGLYISSTFHPFGELKAGESFPIRLARDILTANAGAAVLRFKANTASVICQINILND